MTVESLGHGGPEPPLAAVVTVKPRLHWRPQDVGGDRFVGFQPRKAAHREHREWNQPKREDSGKVEWESHVSHWT